MHKELMNLANVIGKHANLIAAVGGQLILLSFLLAFLTPRIVAPALKSKNERRQSYQARIPITGEDKNKIPLGRNLYVEIPRVMSISESLPVKVTCETPLRSDEVKPADIKATAKLLSPAFEIISTNSPATSHDRKIEWGWLIYPKHVGRHALFLGFEPSLESINLFLRNKSQSEGLEANTDPSFKGSMIAFVTVVDELGLTAAQFAWLRAIGAILGIIGTILAYPMWKRYFEGKTETPPSTSASTGDQGENENVGIKAGHANVGKVRKKKRGK
jgi:hypothetical protein